MDEEDLYENPEYLKAVIRKQQSMLVMYQKNIERHKEKSEELYRKCLRLQNHIVRLNYVADVFGDKSVNVRAKYEHKSTQTSPTLKLRYSETKTE